MQRVLGENVSIVWRLVVGVAVGAIVFVVANTVTLGIFPAIAFAVGALAARLVARR
jgi:hypothetical protein